MMSSSRGGRLSGGRTSGAVPQEHVVVVESTPRGRIMRASRLPLNEPPIEPTPLERRARPTQPVVIKRRQPLPARPVRVEQAPLIVGVEPESQDDEEPPRIEPQVEPAAKQQKMVYSSQPTFGLATMSTGKAHVTVEAPILSTRDQPYVENPLPGVADEVESYPCRYCPERVFLTSFGLERHTKLCHKQHVQEVMNEISRIQEEWKRRESEREKQRERMALAKIRQEALAVAAAREIQASDDRPRSRVPRNEFSSVGSTGDREQYYEQPRDHETRPSNFESCRICGLLINANHPTAMENHMRAHKKNDELRSHLLNAFGPEFVARVTCHECQLVFTDERKLIAHAEAMHVRRRKYVCKWCGHVCLTMTELNNHKADIHGMPVSRSRDPEVRRQRQLTALTRGHGMPPPLGVQSAATRRAVAMAEASRIHEGASPRVLTSVEELPCRTTCDFCGLIMVKPSLLIRHMMRVHNRTSFTATVETKGMPPFKVTVDQGKLSWSCCQESYTDRSSFIYHRRTNHQPRMSHPGSSVIGTRTVVMDSGNERQQQTSNTGSDGQYVVLMVDDNNENKNDTNEQQQNMSIVLTPEQLQQLGIGAEDGENVVLLVDDGSGNLTTEGGAQVVLDQGQQQLMLVQDQGETQGQIVMRSNDGEEPTVVQEQNKSET